jgi:glycosyltransferase involved in cell wall biosynthesis
MRIYHTARILSQRHEVDLLAMDATGAEVPGVLTQVFARVMVFPVKIYRHALQAFAGVFTDRPLQVAGYLVPEVLRWVERNRSRYDVLLCHHVRMAEYVKGYTGLRLLDFHDSIALHYTESIRHARGFWKVWYRFEGPRLSRYEADVLEEFDTAFVTSPVDRDYILANAQGRRTCPLVVLPMGVKEEVLSYPVPQQEEDWAVFLGKMDYYPNEDAACYFAEKVLPLIRTRYGIQLLYFVIGPNPTRRVRRLQRFANVRVLGYVDDPYYYMSRAKVIVAPLRMGAGIQNKVLEGMALRKAVVTTRVGARGVLGAEDGRQLLVAEDGDGMAEAVAELMRSPDFRRRLGTQARRLIEERYTWDVVGRTLLRELP